jgi:hypothetical protein
MLISARAAADLLTGRVSSFEQARRLLRTGVAGTGVPVGGSPAYDDEQVRELAARPWVNERDLATSCPWGVHVARLGRDRSLDVAQPWKEQAEALAVQPRLPAMTAATLGVRMKVAEGLPWVVTVSGFVVFAAETTGWRSSPDGAEAFVLRQPSVWSEKVERRWFASGRGRHWHLWDPARLTQ